MNLKPCPFCGRKPKYKHFSDGVFWYERVTCEWCNLMMTQTGTKDSDGTKVAMHWNYRRERK